METNHFKSNLEHLLSSRNIKPAQLSRDIGTSKQSVSDWLKNDSMITLSQAIKLSKYFAITLDTLFFDDLKSLTPASYKAEIEFLTNSGAAFFAVDVDGSHRFCNPAFAALLGHERSDLMTRPIFELIHSEDLPRYRYDIKRLAKNEIDSVVIEVKTLNKNKKFIWLKYYFINCMIDKKLYLFAFPLKALEHLSVPVKTCKFFIADKIIDELEISKEFSFYISKMDFIYDIEPDLHLTADPDIFKSLVRSIYYQMTFIETESKTRVVKITLKKEDAQIVLTASINCKVHTHTLSIRRLKNIAAMINADVDESLIGNYYAIRFIFNTH